MLIKSFNIYRPASLIILAVIALGLVIFPIYLSTDRASDLDSVKDYNTMHLSGIINLDSDEINKACGVHPSCCADSYIIASSFRLCDRHWSCFWE